MEAEGQFGLNTSRLKMKPTSVGVELERSQLTGTHLSSSVLQQAPLITTSQIHLWFEQEEECVSRNSDVSASPASFLQPVCSSVMVFSVCRAAPVNCFNSQDHHVEK